MLFTLLLLLMGFQTPAPDIIPLESPTTQTGYTQRPSNARTQTYNRYLDWVQAKKTQSLSVWWNAITGYTFTTTWNYAFDIDPDAITIPTDWTYNISINFWFWANYAYVNTFDVMVNDDLLYRTAKESLILWESVQLHSVENLLKWDKITLVIVSDNWALDVDVSLSVTKLS